MKLGSLFEVPFKLKPEDGWPPFEVEWLWGVHLKDGEFCVKTSPYFISNLSVDDEILIEKDVLGNVIFWKHIKKSDNSTIWLSFNGNTDPKNIIKKFKKLGCEFDILSSHGIYTICVPQFISKQNIDQIVNSVEMDDRYCFAFPCDRQI